MTARARLTCDAAVDSSLFTIEGPPGAKSSPRRDRGAGRHGAAAAGRVNAASGASGGGRSRGAGTARATPASASGGGAPCCACRYACGGGGVRVVVSASSRADVNEISSGGWIYLAAGCPKDAFAVAEEVELRGTGTGEGRRVGRAQRRRRVIQVASGFPIDKSGLSGAYLQKVGGDGDALGLGRRDLGWEISAAVLGLGLAYVAIGGAVNHRNTGAVGLAAMPHREQWQQLRGLVTDGWHWTLAGGGDGSSGYQRLEGTEVTDGGRPPSVPSSSSSAQVGKKEKKASKSRSSKSGKGGKGGKGSKDRRQRCRSAR